MKWFKHDTDANQDAKLQNVLLDYGLEGYGLYWYCIEQIAGNVDQDNINFELEHDARIISRNTGSTVQKVTEMMKYFVDVGLFECSNNTITCLKLARRLDKSMTSNPQMREIISNLKGHDKVMIESPKPMQDKIRLDQTREDIKEPIVPPKTKRSKFKFIDEDLRFANEMFNRVLVIAPSAKKPNFENWANTIRLMREVDSRTHKEMWLAFDWANKDSFWCSNILSPDKLRKQFDNLTVKINETTRPANKPDYSDGLSDSQRAMLQARKERDAAQQNNGSILGENGRALLR